MNINEILILIENTSVIHFKLIYLFSINNVVSINTNTTDSVIHVTIRDI